MSIKNKKSKIVNCLGLLCLLLCGCVTEYKPPKIDSLADILVVEGIITDNETIITLSRSVSILEEHSSSFSYVNYADVFVECEDGTRWVAEPLNWDPLSSSVPIRNGLYTIKNGMLEPDRKYRLKIEIEEPDYSSVDCYPDFWGGMSCPTKIYEYASAYSYPIKTPEIDSVFWIKRGPKQPVMIHIATHSPNNSVLYYRWSYKEDWEINSEYNLDTYPYYCWNKANSTGLLIGSAEKTVFGKITDVVTEIAPTNRKLAVLYRINVKQNVISKRAYDYFANIKKNAEQTGSIFAPTPSELRGNITCLTDPDKPVIGYVDISSTTQKIRYIWRREGAYEYPPTLCELTPGDSLRSWNEGRIPDEYILYDVLEFDDTYIRIQCVDCTYYGTTQKPDDWPKNN